MTPYKTKLASLLLLVPALAMAKTDVIDIPAEQNRSSSYSWKIDEDTTLTISRYCAPEWDKLRIFASYKESNCDNSAYVRSTMADDSRTRFGHSYTVTISYGETSAKSNNYWNTYSRREKETFVRSLSQESDPVVKVSGYGQISDDKLIKLDGLKQVKVPKGLIESDPTYSIVKSVRLVGYRDAYNAIHDGAKAEFNVRYDAQNQRNALILIMVVIAVLGGSYVTWKYVLKPSANKLNEKRKEVADKLEKSKVRRIAKEEAIRQTVRTTIENDNAAITALKAQIKEALDNNDAKTAKILMEALDKMENS
ncbi:hypothetical protein J4H64_18195 [Vibrio alginolyticus]|uniref:hypothetical protein n=1 Tax=Vibrio alginolyticus TaxID=663 RepID=UPI0006308108|nr:hypothetical protein [Vibrio alginolyticus]CDT99101.1 exported hypothetical protein [Vibrio diabolicus]ELP3328920.1 hypothetical protein [Vibrio alginolyticus]MBS9907709.1 hypothetical protein [Vibrio alginolyticus]MBS9948347.1 hypothetical protein [Vibrio alginolyticus]MBS9985485.1 hypothetical protein [Vibrio alginolyticus]